MSRLPSGLTQRNGTSGWPGSRRTATRLLGRRCRSVKHDLPPDVVRLRGNGGRREVCMCGGGRILSPCGICFFLLLCQARPVTLRELRQLWFTCRMVICCAALASSDRVKEGAGMRGYISSSIIGVLTDASVTIYLRFMTTPHQKRY